MGPTARRPTRRRSTRIGGRPGRAPRARARACQSATARPSSGRHLTGRARRRSRRGRRRGRASRRGRRPAPPPPPPVGPPQGSGRAGPRPLHDSYPFAASPPPPRPIPLHHCSVPPLSLPPRLRRSSRRDGAAATRREGNPMQTETDRGGSSGGNACEDGLRSQIMRFKIRGTRGE